MNHNHHEPRRGKSSEVTDDTEDLQLSRGGWQSTLAGRWREDGWQDGHRARDEGWMIPHLSPQCQQRL